MNDRKTLIHGLPIIVAAILTAGFAVFVVLYPGVFAHILARHPDNFRQAVDEAVAEGNLTKALRLAEYAARFRYSDPDAFAVCGDLLLQQGDIDRAAEAFEKAVSQTITPPPEYRPTQRPFYHAPARLGLARIALGKGGAPAAVSHLELARPYNALWSHEYAPYQTTLFEAYARQEMWFRVLDFGEPPTERVARLEAESLRRLGAACEATQRWHLARSVGDQFLTRDGKDSYGHYLLGQSFRAEGHIERAIDHFRKAAASGSPASLFYLGLLEEEQEHKSDAADALLSVPETSFYRPFAIARASALVESGQKKEALLQELESWFVRDLTTGVQEKPPSFRDSSLRPVAVDLAQAGQGWFPILVRWEYDGPDLPLQATINHDGSMTLSRGRQVLQAQWVMNEIPTAGFESFQPGEQQLPGWIDPDTVWHTPPYPPCFSVAVEEDGNRHLAVKCEDLTRFCRVHTVPLQVERGAGYLCAGRFLAPETPGVFGWEFANRKDFFQGGHNMFNQSKAAHWTWAAAYATPQYLWTAVRVQAGIYQAVGEACFDDLMLFQLREPSLPGSHL